MVNKSIFNKLVRQSLLQEKGNLWFMTSTKCNSGHLSTAIKIFQKSKDYRKRPGLRAEEDAYLNNAKVSNSPGKRVAIKIPKCETKNRRTFFPVILSRYNTHVDSWATNIQNRPVFKFIGVLIGGNVELFFVVNFFEGEVEIQIQTHKSQLFLLQ